MQVRQTCGRGLSVLITEDFGGICWVGGGIFGKGDGKDDELDMMGGELLNVGGVGSWWMGVCFVSMMK